MPKLHENNVNLRKLTPFERALAAHEKNAHLMQIMVETQLLVEGLEKAKDADPSLLPTLERLADEAIIALATELEEKHGVSA